MSSAWRFLGSSTAAPAGCARCRVQSVAPERCRDVAVGVQVLPVEDVAGVTELLEEGAAVALAELVDGVDFSGGSGSAAAI